MKKFIFCLLISAFLTATIVFAKEHENDPETVVELSVFDLVKRKKTVHRPKLSADFAKNVAAAIQKEKNLLTKCVTEPFILLQSEILISPKGIGTARIKNDSSAAANCIIKILSGISYPKHQLTKDVVVKLPLRLEKEDL
ncbi:MAG: hypothetical protein AB7F43_10145 [Bacteriovoracia bacterium]